MHGALRRAADQFGDRIAICAEDDACSFAALHRQSCSFSRHVAGAGVRPGDRVAVMLGNRIELVAVVHGISAAGASAVMLSPAWKAAEIDHALKLTSPRRAVAEGRAVDLLAERLGLRLVDDIDRLPAEPPTAVASPAADPGADVVLVFSSGTTGMPKAVRHTHLSIRAATAHWSAALGLGSDDRFQVATPMSHILGLLNVLAALDAGATVRLHRRFDLDEVLHRIESERMTLEMAVAPIALAMMKHPRLESHDLSSLRYIMWGATPVTESVARTVTARTGIRFLPAYGASEFPVIAVNPIARPEAWRLDSAGLPPAGVELRVVSLETGEPLAAGAVGEIEVRGASMMAGYLPEVANAEAFHDCWYRTGDVGWIEAEGWVHLTDRAKEMIKVSGFQVAPAEIEAVLHGHPAVIDCAVFGVPDERAGEVPVAAVQLDPAQPVELDELRGLVARSLAGYKQLREIVTVDSVPRLPSGKVLRRELRDRWLRALHRGHLVD